MYDDACGQIAYLRNKLFVGIFLTYKNIRVVERYVSLFHASNSTSGLPFKHLYHILVTRIICKVLNLKKTTSATESTGVATSIQTFLPAQLNYVALPCPLTHLENKPICFTAFDCIAIKLLTNAFFLGWIWCELVVSSGVASAADLVRGILLLRLL